ncbi:PXA domain-containing protein [Geopyxis carbonaria]|nr:PXA domain-containing protein [Geopyxis carbonaria]
MTSSSAAPSPPPNNDRTRNLIRRILCSHAAPTVPLEELLPALTSSPAVDEQLYAIVAVLLRAFVLSWYVPITHDRELLDELLALIAHFSRAIEQRLRAVDLELLLLDEIPAIVEAHINDYRTAVARENTVLAPHLTLTEIFHNFQPHTASPGDEDAERTYLRVMVTALLCVFLPIENLESNVERTFLTELLSSAVLYTALDRLSEPAFIYSLVPLLLPSPPPKPPPPPQSPIWLALEYIYIALSLLAALVGSIVHLTLHTTAPQRHPKKKPLLLTSVAPLAVALLNLRRIHPWIPAVVRFLTNPFTDRRSRAGALADDVLAYYFAPALTAATVESMLKLARATLTPGDALAPPKPAVPVEEARRSAEDAIMRVLPGWIAGVWFGERDQVREGVRKEWLDPWGVKEINKVLLLRVLDAFVASICPELLEMGGAEIFEERTGVPLGETLDDEDIETDTETVTDGKGK